MRILYMGTPMFAVPSLIALHEHGHDICAVISQPDKPKGRGMKFQAAEVKLVALERNLTVYQPTTLRDGEAMKLIEELAPELIVVVAYGQILPENILNYPKYGCINVHGSLLPAYRGAAPIQWAVLDGLKTTGITTMYMEKGLDTGDMLLKCETEIGEYETSQQLTDRLMHMGAELLIETIEKLKKNQLEPEKQDDSLSSYAKMLSKEMAVIDFNKNAREITNLVCGLNPWPVATTMLDGNVLKVYSVLIGGDTNKKAGEIISADAKNGLVIATGDGKELKLLEIQLSGKKRMKAEDFLRGYTVKDKAL